MKTTVELLEQELDIEMKLGTKMVVDWDMYKKMEKERMIDFVKKFSDFNGITFNEKMISKEFLEKFYNETFKSE